MRRDFRAYLVDVLGACEEIQAFTAGLDLDAYDRVSLVRAGVERKFEIIGEAVVQCKHHYPDLVGQLGDVRTMVDFRNLLAHRYDTVASEIVWDIVEHDVAPLLERVKALLKSLDVKETKA